MNGSIERIVVDALQVAPEFSGIGRRLFDIGEDFRRNPPDIPLHVRCARDVAEWLRPAFPEGTEFLTPIPSSRPRERRIAYQHLVAPFFDRKSTLLVCPGDQAPVWGRARVLFIIHDVRRVTVPESSEGRLESLYYRIVIRRGVGRAAAILTISDFSRNEIERLYRPSVPISVIKTPPEITPSASSPRTDDPALLTVGALRSYKGLETLVAALGRLAADGARVPRVICVGTDETGAGYAKRLQKLASEHGVADRLELRGWVSDPELQSLREECIGTISPSDYEGYGLPLAESLGGGMPSIASSIPPHREIAADAALYFDPGDAKGLATAIGRLVEDEALRAGLGEKALVRAAAIGEGCPSWAEAIKDVARKIT